MKYKQSTKLAQSLLSMLEVIRFIYQKGWAPATSTNFSFCVEEIPNVIFITRSGVDKGLISAKDFLAINLEGQVLNNPKVPSSAETSIHLAIYRQAVKARAVVHSHSKASTVLSLLFAQQKLLPIQGLDNINTHLTSVNIPILPNTEDINELAQKFEKYLESYPSTYGILIEGHGFYTWGNSITTAKRHLEVFEFLFECLLNLPNYGNPQNT